MRGSSLGFAALCLLAVSGAGAEVTLISKPINGVVVDASTGKPVPGAIVTATWMGSFSTVAHGGTRCPKGMSVAADAAGRFSFPEWSMKHPDLDNLLVAVSAYRSGWTSGHSATAGANPTKLLGFIPVGKIEIPSSELTVEMKQSREGPKERREYLVNFLRSTSCQDGDVTSMALLYRAIRDEASSLPPEVRDYRSMPGRLTLLELIDMGYLKRTQ